MRKLSAILLLSTALCTGALAQSGVGQLPAFNVSGNPTGSPAPPTAFPIFSTTNAWSAQQTFAANGTANFGAGANITGRAFVGNGASNFWPFSPTNYISSNPFLYVQDPYGTNAIATYMRSSDWAATYPPNGLGNVGQIITNLNFTLADRTGAGPSGLWGAYSQFVRTATALTSIGSIQHELSMLDLSAAAAAADPYNFNNANATHMMRIDAGVSITTPLGAGVDITTGYEILNNGNKFKTGFLVGYNAINAVGGHINAITMPASMRPRMAMTMRSSARLKPCWSRASESRVFIAGRTAW